MCALVKEDGVQDLNKKLRYHIDMLHSWTGISHGKREKVSNINLILSSKSNNHRAGFTAAGQAFSFIHSKKKKTPATGFKPLSPTVKLYQIKISIQKLTKVGSRSRGGTMGLFAKPEPIGCSYQNWSFTDRLATLELRVCSVWILEHKRYLSTMR